MRNSEDHATYRVECLHSSIRAGNGNFQPNQELPREELYSLTDQIRRSSRSVCSNVAEGWRKRIYQAAFCNKLSDAEAKAAETQAWIEFSVRCQYLNRNTGVRLYVAYDRILAMLVSMRNELQKWILPSGKRKRRKSLIPFSLSPFLGSRLLRLRRRTRFRFDYDVFLTDDLDVRAANAIVRILDPNLDLNNMTIPKDELVVG